MMSPSVISATRREREALGAIIIEQLYNVLKEPKISAFMSTMTDEKSLPINNHLSLKKDGIYHSTSEMDEYGDYNTAFHKLNPIGNQNLNSEKELVVNLGLTPDKLRKVIHEQIDGVQPKVDLSQLQYPPKREFSAAFDRLKLRETVDLLSSNPQFHIRNPEYFIESVKNPNFSLNELLNKALKIGKTFYVKEPDSILSKCVHKVEALSSGEYKFAPPKARKKYKASSDAEAVSILGKITKYYDRILVEKEIPGLKYMFKAIELRLLVNSEHRIVGHYVKNGTGWLLGRKKGIDTATALRRSLLLYGLSWEKAKSVATEALEKLSDSISVLAQHHKEFGNDYDKRLLASVDLIPVYDKKHQKIEWFLLESEAPENGARRRIGIDGLRSVSKVMYSEACEYRNSW